MALLTLKSNPLVCLLGVGGTAGDVRPLLTLAAPLRSRGFEILVVGDHAFEETARRAGVRPAEWFSCCQVPQTFQMRTAAGQRWLRGQRIRRRDRAMLREFAAHKAARMDAFWRRLGDTSDPRLVAVIGSLSAWEVMERFGPRCAKIVSGPMPYQPSRHFTLLPPDMTPAQRLRIWARERPGKTAVLRRFCQERFHLLSVSPSVFPRPEDWLPNMQVTGCPPFPHDEGAWSPPAQLNAFLKDGAPPVYVGAGSYPFFFGPDGERLAREVIEGCRRQQVRCVIQSSDLPHALNSSQVLILDADVPHAWLFPRCCAIVHHGGYGTLHAALTARRPMVMYPFQSDQFFWTTRMGQIGAGPGFTARLRELSATRLARDLEWVRCGDWHPVVERLATAIANEQGLHRQVAAITSIIDHTSDGGGPVEWRMPACEAACEAVS